MKYIIQEFDELPPYPLREVTLTQEQLDKRLLTIAQMTFSVYDSRRSILLAPVEEPKAEMSVAELRKAATAVYVAMDESVAADISKKFTWAADKIESLTPKPSPVKVDEWEAWKAHCLMYLRTSSIRNPLIDIVAEIIERMMPRPSAAPDEWETVHESSEGNVRTQIRRKVVAFTEQ